MKIEGIDALLRKLERNTNIDDVKRVVKQNGASLQVEAQRRCPVDTGTLKASIGLNVKDNGMTAEVEPTMHYAPYVEYGTRYMSAQPYVRPALEAQKQKFISDLNSLTK